jgi:hypothetical protein
MTSRPHTHGNRLPDLQVEGPASMAAGSGKTSAARHEISGLRPAAALGLTLTVSLAPSEPRTA